MMTWDCCNLPATKPRCQILQLVGLLVQYLTRRRASGVERWCQLAQKPFRDSCQMTLWSALAGRNRNQALWCGRFMLCHKVGNISKSNEIYGKFNALKVLLQVEAATGVFNTFRSLFIQVVHNDFVNIPVIIYRINALNNSQVQIQ